MNTNEQNRRAEQAKTRNVAPNDGSDKKEPIVEPAKKAEESQQNKTVS